MSSPSSSSAVGVVSLAYVNVQADFGAVVRDVAQSVVRREDFWVSCYQQGKQATHAKVHCSTDDDGDLKVTASGGVVVSPIGEDSTAPITVSFPSFPLRPTTIRQPRQRITRSLSPSLPKTINSLSLSSTHPLVVVGGDDGALSVHGLASSAGAGAGSVVSLGGCVGDVLSTRFFPSGEVTLSTTLATTVLVHSALPPSSAASSSSSTNEPVRVLRGHTRAVTCSAVLGRGKHVLTGSKDKSVRRWDVANAVCVGSVDFGDEVWSIVLESDHVGWVGLKSGGLWRIDLDDANGITHSAVGIEGGSEGGVQALAYQDGLLAVGTERGILSIVSLGSGPDVTPTVVAKVQRSTGGIHSVAFLLDGRLVVGGEDGMPWIAGPGLQSLDDDGNGDGRSTWGVSEELAGWEDAIVDVATTPAGDIWVASAKEGIARY